MEGFGSIVALIIAVTVPLWPYLWKKYYIKPDLKPQKFISHRQNDKTIYRLVIKNEGRDTTREVEVYVEKITVAGNKEQNFVPVPLNWTHSQIDTGRFASKRDIHPNQTALLDVLMLDNGGSSLYVFDSVGMMQKIQSKPVKKTLEASLQLNIYQQSGDTIPIKIDVNWPQNEDLAVSIHG